MKSIIIIILVIMIVAEACKKPYVPSIVVADNNFLVVEGLINTGPDSTFFKLSRTVQLSSNSTVKPELNAEVTVESDQNTSYSLPEAGNGVYSSVPLNLSSTAKYRLRIKTSDNKEYLSDFVEVKSTPDIDSVIYQQQNNGLQLYVNAHDAENNTHYYRWDFTEVWKYVSLYQSFYKLDADGFPVFRAAYRGADNIFECYRTDPSLQVMLGSSAKLGHDVIYKQPLNFIPQSSGKISNGYYYFLRQYALTTDGFNYWQQLKKNTEQLGSIFDAQPSSLQGNIHCTSNPKEPVLGFISASSVKKKALFIDPINLSLFLPHYLKPPDVEACVVKFIPVDPAESFHDRLSKTFGSGDSTLVQAKFALLPSGPVITAYSYAPTECVDCRTKIPFGTNTIPGYWPYH